MVTRKVRISATVALRLVTLMFPLVSVPGISIPPFANRTPSIVWLPLTSKLPFTTRFCTRLVPLTRSPPVTSNALTLTFVAAIGPNPALPALRLPATLTFVLTLTLGASIRVVTRKVRISASVVLKYVLLTALLLNIPGI